MGRYNLNAHWELVDITPQMAKRWLEHNEGNRPINHAAVNVMVKDILANQWDTSHQGIAIASDGTVVDGQHRLTAIVKANKTVKMWVQYNAIKSSHIDAGLKRSESNRMQMGDEEMGWINQRILASINLVIAIFPRMNLNQTENKMRWCKEHAEELQIANNRTKRTKIKRLNSSGVAAAYLTALLNNVPESYIAEFSEAFTSGFTRNDAEKYAILLRNELLGYSENVEGSTWRKYVYYRACNRINQFYLEATGQKAPKRIQEDDFPYDIRDIDDKIVYRKGKISA